VTTATSLFATPAADITLDKIRELVSQTPSESLTIEYKEQFSSSLVKTVAAMANSYGGLILVGIKDQGGANRTVGVPSATATQIVNACHESLEPPWQPEIIQVPLPDSDDACIVIARVDAAKAPRPLLLQGTAPVRLHGRNAIADRARLVQLVTEAAPVLQPFGQHVAPPRLPDPQKLSGWPDPLPADFVLRSGLVLPLDERVKWKPLSEALLSALAAALNKSPIFTVLGYWCHQCGTQGFNPFDRRGYNRSRHARLTSQAVSTNAEVPHPVEAVFEVHLPDRYGAPTSSMTVTLDLLLRHRLFLAANGWPAPTRWRLQLHDLYVSLDGVIAALIDQAVVATLADLAGIDPVVVAQPFTLDFYAGPPAGELLESSGLRLLPDAGPSGGANLVADPSLDLSNPSERGKQLDAWVEQIALDAGLLGMEKLLVAYRAQQEGQPQKPS